MLIGGKQSIPHSVRDIADATAAFSAYFGTDKHFENQQALEDCINECYKPQRIITIGLSETGKSTTLDTLIDDTICSVVKNQSPITRWQYSPKVSIEHEWIENRYYPALSLINIEFWDTQGIEKPEITTHLHQIISETDIRLVILKADNIYAETVWSFLQELDPALYAHTILVITHIDGISYSQLQTLKEELRTHSKNTLGVQLALYSLTFGKKPATDAEALRSYVQELLIKAPRDNKKITYLLSKTEALLAEQGNVLNELEKLSRMDANFLTTIDKEIDQIQRQFEDTQHIRLEAYSDYIHESIKRLAKKSARQLGRILSIRRAATLHKLSPFVSIWFYNLIRNGIKERQAVFHKDFIITCQDHWEQVRPRIKTQWQYDIGDFPSDKLQESLNFYNRRMSWEIPRILSDYGIKPCLAQFYKERQSVMKGIIYLFLSLIICGSIFGSLGESDTGVIFILASFAVWIIASMCMNWMQYSFAKRVQNAALDIKPYVMSSLRSPLYEAVTSSISDYRKLYTDIRVQIIKGTEHIAPLIRKRDHLSFKLRAQQQIQNR